MNAPHVRRLLCAKGLRAFGDGYRQPAAARSICSRWASSPFEVGVIATGTLLGLGHR